MMMHDIAVADPLIDEDFFYEEVDGQRISKGIMSAFEIDVACNLLTRMRPWGWDRDLGRAVMEMLFELPGIPRKRRPDVAFVTFARWPKRKRVPRTDEWSVAPDLAVEIVSRTNAFEHILEKVAEYFAAGVQIVWVVVPGPQQVYVYTSPTRNQILSVEGELTGEPVLPGFRLAVAELFPEGVEAVAEDNGSI